MNQGTGTVDTTQAAPPTPGHPLDPRRKALQQELQELLDVVGPVSLIDLLFERAFQLRATDIHFDAHETGMRIRMRVDGMLHDVLQVAPAVGLQMVSRIKLMADMNITERRTSQDGHINSRTLGSIRDIRAGSVPTSSGERLVLRLMHDAQSFNRLDELGLEPHQVTQFQTLLARPYGTILSVGPVGSGKSTLMYSCLEYLNDPTKSLVSIEDPVERRVPGISQIQIDSKIGFGFAEALRGVMRQDPNTIMIGEIRDPETAQIAIRAGRTGVLVLSTAHAYEATACIDVFRDFGVSPMFIADGIQAIIAQRLIRKVCNGCRVTYTPDETTCAILGIPPEKAAETQLAKGTGCDQCFRTGYYGRTGVFEILDIDHDLRHAILSNLPHRDLYHIARQKGVQSLQEVAILKVRAGITTVEEMNRVLLAYGGR